MYTYQRLWLAASQTAAAETAQRWLRVHQQHRSNGMSSALRGWTNTYSTNHVVQQYAGERSFISMGASGAMK
jgi:hypothetical protein